MSDLTYINIVIPSHLKDILVSLCEKVEDMKVFARYDLVHHESGITFECRRSYGPDATPPTFDSVDRSTVAGSNVNWCHYIKIDEVNSLDQAIKKVNQLARSIDRAVKRTNPLADTVLAKDFIEHKPGLMTLNGQDYFYQVPSDIAEYLEKTTGKLWSLWLKNQTRDHYYMYRSSIVAYDNGERAEKEALGYKQNPPDKAHADAFCHYILDQPKEGVCSKHEAMKLFGYFD